MEPKFKVGDPVWIPGRRSEDYPDAATIAELEGPEALVTIPATTGRVRIDRLELRETTQEEASATAAKRQCAVPIEPCARCGRPATRIMWEWEGTSRRSDLWVAWVCELFNCADELEGLWKGPPWRPMDQRSGVYNARPESRCACSEWGPGHLPGCPVVTEGPPLLPAVAFWLGLAVGQRVRLSVLSGPHAGKSGAVGEIRPQDGGGTMAWVTVSLDDGGTASVWSYLLTKVEG